MRTYLKLRVDPSTIREFFRRNPVARPATPTFRSTVPKPIKPPKPKKLFVLFRRPHCYRRIFIRRIKPLKQKPDPAYVRKRHRLKTYLRGKIWQFLKHALHAKSAAKLIGCDRPQFIAYLRPLLKAGMTFENYGPVWHLDHIIPCKFFDLFNADQRRLCFHYSNFQPMFARLNRRKSASLPPDHLLRDCLATLSAISASTQTEFPFTRQPHDV